MRKIFIFTALLCLMPVCGFTAQQLVEAGAGIYWGNTGDLGEKANSQIINEDFTELYTRTEGLNATISGFLSGVNEDIQVAIDLNTAKITNATHTGDVTGNTALTLESVAITGQTLATAVSTDYVIISDTSDTGALKRSLISDLSSAGGGVTDHGALTGLTDNDHTGYLQTVVGGANVTVDNTDTQNPVINVPSAGGDITAVTAGTGLSGGGVTGDVTLNIDDTAVTPNTYTFATVTVNQQGQITSASSGSPGGGDLSSPDPIGDTVPNTGSFTYLQCDSLDINPPSSGSTGELAIHEDPTSDGGDMIGFKAPHDVNVGGVQGGDLLWVLPSNDGSPGQAIVTDGSQTLSFASLKGPVAVPSAANASGAAGDWAYDADYYYICVTDDTWKRVGVATW